MREGAGDQLGPRHGALILYLVDLLADPGAETPAPMALRHHAEFPAAAITLIDSHFFALTA
jgi:hypothetical protein